MFIDQNLKSTFARFGGADETSCHSVKLSSAPPNRAGGLSDYEL